MYIFISIVILIISFIRISLVYNSRLEAEKLIYRYKRYIFDNTPNLFDPYKDYCYDMMISYKKNLFCFWLNGKYSSIKSNYHETLKSIDN